jgi:hypothetical protein
MGRWHSGLCASEGSFRGHPSEGLAVARRERARMPASDERTATEAPLLSPPLPDDHRYLIDNYVNNAT